MSYVCPICGSHSKKETWCPEHPNEPLEARPVCVTCHQAVPLWDWALTPILVKKKVTLVPVCHPKCKDPA